jgi:hypothetical protein
MQQTCPHCDYESPASARFCRQCGAPLFAETDLSAASTRNYGRQEPAPSVVAPGSGHLPPSVADAVAGDTERYYRAPMAPPPPVPTTAPIKSRITAWRWILLLLVLLIGTSIGALLTAGLVRQEEHTTPPEEMARIHLQEEAQRRQEEMRREMEDRIREAQDRIREAEQRQLEAFERAREAAEQASEAGAALAPANERPLDLTQYEYPGATLSNSIRIPGHEMLTMQTYDVFVNVSQFYQKKLGKPVIEINEEWEKRLLFQSNTEPPISISVETLPAPNRPQLKIVVLRSPLRILKLDDLHNPK